MAWCWIRTSITVQLINVSLAGNLGNGLRIVKSKSTDLAVEVLQCSMDSNFLYGAYVESNANNVMVYYSTIQGNWTGGIRLGGTGNGGNANVVESCRVYGNGYMSQEAGIRIVARGNLVSENYVYYNYGDGVSVELGNENVVRYNSILGNGGQGIYVTSGLGEAAPVLGPFTIDDGTGQITIPYMVQTEPYREIKIEFFLALDGEGAGLERRVGASGHI